MASTAAVSEVEVSVSTLRLLKVRATTSRVVRSSRSAGTSASVSTKVSMVAMSGSIMPTPLATPTIRGASGPSPTLAEAVLANVSVVIIPVATRMASVSVNGPVSCARCERMRSIGYCRPMTPVEVTSTSSAAQPTATATPTASSSALANPSAPVATFAFFDTTTSACSEPSATWRRDTSTLGPAKRDLVKTALAVQGVSAATTTKSSVSSLIPMLATWAWKPRGRGTVLIGSEVWHGAPHAAVSIRRAGPRRAGTLGAHDSLRLRARTGRRDP